MLTIIPADVTHIPVIQELAEKTWWPTYGEHLAHEQIRYMLEAIYSTEALAQTMTTQPQQFLILKDEGRSKGFAAFGKRSDHDDIYKLHKLYVLPANQGKGYGRALIEDIKARVKKSGGRFLDLNVARFNNAKSFYERMGFSVMYEEDVPIGPYWMKDYVMRTAV